MRTKLIFAKSRLNDEQGFIDLFMLGIIAVAVILIIAFLFGGIIMFLGAMLVVVGLILLFMMFEVAGLVTAGVGLVMVLISTQLHMGIIQSILGGLF